MKKRYFLAISSLAVLTIAACSDTATPISGTKEESNLTVQQVFDKAIERQNSINSVHAVVDMNQVMEMNVEGQTIHFTTASNLTMDVNQSPIAMYTKGTVGMNMVDEKMMEVPLEMYMTEKDGFYMLNGKTNEWLKLPAEQYDQMLAQTGAQADAAQQLEQLKQFVDDFTFEQDNNDYKLTLTIEGEKFKEFIMAQMGTSLGETMEMSGNELTNMTFEDSKYDIVIAKDTFDTKEIDMDLTILMDVEGQQTKIENDANVVYSQFDKVERITIPNEVKNKAISQ